MFICAASIFLFKQKTAYEMRISDWSSDVCSSDLHVEVVGGLGKRRVRCRSRHELGLGDPSHLAGVLAGHLDGEEDALGAPGGELAAGGGATEQVGGHAHDLLLHPQEAREREGVEVVLVQVDRKSTRLNSSH